MDTIATDGAETHVGRVISGASMQASESTQLKLSMFLLESIGATSDQYARQPR